MKEILDKIKAFFEKFMQTLRANKSPRKQPDPAETLYNQRAQNEYVKRLKAFTEQYGTPNMEQEAILYAQAYEMQIIKNPASAKFPPIEEFCVTANGETYTVTGYLDATNSYGAQVRENLKLNLVKRGDRWLCTDKHTSIQTMYLYILLGIFLVSLLVYWYYSAQLSKLF